MNVIADDIDMEQIIGDAKLIERLPTKDKQVLLRANAYYMNNRENFVNFTNALFRPYKEEFDKAESTISCDKPDDAKFALLTHQKIVRDYLNIYTPLEDCYYIMVQEVVKLVVPLLLLKV